MPFNVSWWLNGRPVDYFEGISVNMVNKKLSTLSIDSVNAIHSGEYACKVENRAGQAEYKAYLRVNGILPLCTRCCRYQ